MYKNRREISPGTNGADFNPPRGPSGETDTRINNSWRVLCHFCSPNIHPLNTYSYYRRAWNHQGPRDGVNLRARGSAPREQTDARCQRKYRRPFESIKRAAGGQSPGPGQEAWLGREGTVRERGATARAQS